MPFAIDMSPLGTLVQLSVALAIMRDKTDNFGHRHDIEIGALTLVGLAEYYLGKIAAQFGIEEMHSFEDVYKALGQGVSAV